jgi:hypothetical protein
MQSFKYTILSRYIYHNKERVFFVSMSKNLVRTEQLGGLNVTITSKDRVYALADRAGNPAFFSSTLFCSVVYCVCMLG